MESLDEVRSHLQSYVSFQPYALQLACSVAVANAASILSRVDRSGRKFANWSVACGCAAAVLLAASNRTLHSYAGDFLTTEPLALLLTQLLVAVLLAATHRFQTDDSGRTRGLIVSVAGTDVGDDSRSIIVRGLDPRRLLSTVCTCTFAESMASYGCCTAVDVGVHVAVVDSKLRGAGAFHAAGNAGVDNHARRLLRRSVGCGW